MSNGAVGFRYIVLGLLARKPMSGYDIKGLLKGLNWLIGSPSFGNLYPTLHRLLHDGLVTVETSAQDSRPPRKVYSITDQGRQLVEEWVRNPIKDDAPLKAFVLRLLLADAHSEAGLATYLEQRRRQVATQQAALHQYVAGERTDDNPHPVLVLDYGLALAEAELTWLERALTRLTSADLEPAWEDA